MSTKRFLGYDRNDDGQLVVNQKQAKIVKRLYWEFLSGKTVDYIKRIFEREGVKNWNGSTKWEASTLQSMLENEKYKGDAVLQNSYTTDFLTKKRVMNQGEIQMFYVEEDHEAIIEPWIWECVQLEMTRRKEYLRLHGTNSYLHNTEKNPFASKVVCGMCGKVFTRKGWQGKDGKIRRVWQWGERYKVKGVMGCSNRHVEETTLAKVFVMAWNGIVENLDYFRQKWGEHNDSEDLLQRYRVKDFRELSEQQGIIEVLETDFMLRVLGCVKVFEDGTLRVVFLDGTEIECGNE